MKPRFEIGEPVWVYWANAAREAAVIIGLMKESETECDLCQGPIFSYTVDKYPNWNNICECIIRKRYDNNGKSIDEFMTEIRNKNPLASNPV